MDTKEVKIRYLKSYDFKTTLATGVYGGITTNGLINANFFVDRIVIPESQIIQIDNTGLQMGAAKENKDGDIVREIDYSVLMDLNTAKIILNWLQIKIKEHEELIKPQP